MMRRLSHPLMIHLAVFGFYLIIAVIVTYPLVANLSSTLAGFILGDGYEMAHHIWWFKHALQTGQPLFFQPLLAYPNGIEGVSLWADPLQFFPAWLFAFVLPLPAAANITILLTLALNGWAMFYLVNYLIRAQHAAPLHDATIPALLAGLVFMLYPTMQGHLGAGHAGLLVLWTVPLYIYALLRLRERGGAPSGGRRIALAALFFFLSVTGYTLNLIFVTLPVTLPVVLLLIVRREWLALRRIVVAIGVGGVVLGVFLIPVFRTTLETSTYTEARGIVQYSADLLAVVTPSFYHPLFDQLEFTHRILGVNLDEGTAYVGVIAAFLSLIAVWKVRESRGWLLLAVLVWILSLGPLLKILDQTVMYHIDGYASYVTLPFALIANLPLINLGRTPARFNFALAVAVALMAGYGTAYLWNRIRLSAAVKRGGLALLMVGIAFEYQVFWPLSLTPAAIPQPISDLAGRPDVRAVFDVPWQNFATEKNALYLQTAHQRPLIAGHVTRGTPVSPAKLSLLQATLDPALLRAAGADVVIVHREQDGEGTYEAFARGQLGDPIYEDTQFAVFETPQTADVPEFMALPTDAETITDEADSFVYAPEDGWVTISADLQTDDARDVVLLRDGVVAQRWTVEGSAALRAPIPVSAGSFHTIALALDPPCPMHFDAALECRTVGLENVALDFTPAEAFNPARFERGVTLANAHIPAEARAGAALAVWLWWQFDQPRDLNDIRFVHLTDAAGALVGQQDNTLGAVAAGETRAESVEIALPADLPPGEYTVSTGWYVYPDITHFCILVDGTCGAGVLTLGTVTVAP